VDAKPGDRIEVSSVQVGQAVRRGTVVEVISRDPMQLRVRWDDGHESTLFPSGGMVRVVEHASA